MIRYRRRRRPTWSRPPTSASEVGLTWTAATDNTGVTGYRLERCTNAGCNNFVQIATPPGTSYTDIGLAAATSYTYRVRAVDAATNLGPYSNTSTTITTAPADTTPPTAPTNLVAAATSASEVGLTWTAATDNTGVTGYRLERCTNAGCNNFVQIATPPGTSYTDIGLAAATSYTYRVRAVDAATNLGPYSNSSTTITTAPADTTPPTAPTNLVAAATSASEVGLTWTAATDNTGVTGYRLERCTNAGCNNFVQIATPPGTSYTDIGLAAATSYTYRVRAVDAATNLGPYSNTSTTITTAPADTTPPTAPTNLVAAATSASEVGLTWTAATDNTGVTGYRLERCTNAGCNNFVQIATPPGTSYTDIGLAAATSYTYRVRAVDAATNLGPYSNTSTTITTAPADTTPPTAPTNLVAAATSASEVGLTWTAATDNTGVTGYRLERCTNAGCNNFVQIATPPGTSYTDIGLAAATSYTYRVRAVDAATNLGPYSNTSTTITTAPATPRHPRRRPTWSRPPAAPARSAHLDRRHRQHRCDRLPLERCTNAGCNNFVQIATPPGTSYTDIGLAAATSYTYRVRAVDAATNLGPYSNTSTTITCKLGCGVWVRGRDGSQCRRCLRLRQQRPDRHRRLDKPRPLRQRAELQRQHRPRHHRRRPLPPPQLRNDPRSLGLPNRHPRPMARRDLQRRRQLLPDGGLQPLPPRRRRHLRRKVQRDIRPLRHPAQQLDSPRRQLRRNHTPPLRQRHPGREQSANRRSRRLHQPAPNRRRRHLRPILRRPHRRSPRLQHRPHPTTNPNRHEHRSQRVSGSAGVHDDALTDPRLMCRRGKHDRCRRPSSSPPATSPERQRRAIGA